MDFLLEYSYHNAAVSPDLSVSLPHSSSKVYKKQENITILCCQWLYGFRTLELNSSKQLTQAYTFCKAFIDHYLPIIVVFMFSIAR